MARPNTNEKGYAWILQEAKDLAEVEILSNSIGNFQWEWDSSGPLPEPKLCFDYDGKRYSIPFTEAEVDDCAMAHLDCKRPLVTRRIQDFYRNLKRRSSAA